MRRLWSFLAMCLMTALGMTAQSQEVKETVRLEVVKYPGLKDVIRQNRGKVILVDFWANTCIPCLKGFPHVVQLHKKFAKDGLAVVSVNLDLIDDPASPEKALKILKKFDADFSNLLLEEPSTFWQKKFGFDGPPCYFVFNRQGQWTKFEPQENDPSHEAMEKFILERLKDQ